MDPLDETTAPAPLPRARATVLVVIAGSAGAITVLRAILGELPEDLPAAIAVVQHRSPASPSVLADVLRSRTRLRVTAASEGASLECATVYVAPPDRHLTIAHGRIHLVDGPRIRHVASSANPLFESAAEEYGDDVLAIVLTGYDGDGSDGVESVAASGGTVIVQDPATAHAPGMPRSAIATGVVDAVITPDRIANEIVRFVEAHAPRTA